MSRKTRRPTARPLLDSLLSHRLVLAIVFGAGLAGSLSAAAGEVYQWKDAKGVTHYSDSPPPNQAHKSRAINQKGNAAVQVAAKPVVANSDCSNARSNLTLLQGKEPVGVDDNKDGKPDRTLTAQERANRTALAAESIKTYCEVALANQP